MSQRIISSVRFLAESTRRVAKTLTTARLKGSKLFFCFEKTGFLRHQRISMIFVLSFLSFTPVLYAMDGSDGFEVQKKGVEKVIIEASYVVNMHYEYDDTDIANLLLFRAQEAGLDLTRTVFMPPLENTGGQIGEQLRRERDRYQERVLLGEIKPMARTILVPVNLNNIYWIGLVIRIDEHNQVSRIQYVDSLGESTLEDSIPDEIRRSLKIVYGRRIYIENLMLLRQTDRTSCGVLAIENLIRVAQDKFDTEIASEELIRQIRNHHIALLQQFRPDLRFNARQEKGVGRCGIQKTVELFFSSLSNEMLFYRFLQGRLIFLYGTSTAGKTSIVDFFKSEARLKSVNLAFTGTDAVSELHCLHAFLRYSPDKVNLLRHYFTIKEVLKGIYSSHFASRLINEIAITEKKARLIQSAFEDLRANKKEIMQKFLSYSERPRFCAKSILHALASGKTVIVDTVSPDEFFNAIAIRMMLCRIDIVIVYCPPKQLIDRLYYRNVEALESKSMDNCRPGAFPLMQYTKIYEPTGFPNQSIDNVDFSDIQIPKRLPEVCRLVYEHDGQLHRYWENQWIDVVDLMQKSFGVNTIKDSTFVKPRHSYHFFVNTGKESTAICVEKLLKFLWGLEKCIGVARNGMSSSEPMVMVVASVDDSNASSSHNDTSGKSSGEDSSTLSSPASPHLSETPSSLLLATDVTEDKGNETPIAQADLTESKIERDIGNVISDGIHQNIYQSFIEQLMDILHAALFDMDTAAVEEKLKELERQVRESNLNSVLKEELVNRIAAIKTLLSQDATAHAAVLGEQEIDLDIEMDPDKFVKIFGKFIARDPSDVLPRVAKENYLDIAGATAINDKIKQVSNGIPYADRNAGMINSGADLPVLSTLDIGTTLSLNLFEQELTGVSFFDQTKSRTGSIFDIASSVGVLKVDRLPLPWFSWKPKPLFCGTHALTNCNI